MRKILIRKYIGTIIYRLNYNVAQFIGKFTYKYEKTPYYIVYMDGGICSQMYQYMIGYILGQKGNNIKYDVSWFLKDGKDMQGNQVRNFDLLKLCPNLKINIAKEDECKKFRRIYNYSPQLSHCENRINNIPPPSRYIGGYYNLDNEMYSMFGEILKIEVVLDEKNKKIFNEINSSNNTVGVHVRRGDMVEKGYYWSVLKPEYYAKAVNRFVGDYTFYFFSDDVAWTENYIFPLLKNKKCKIVSINDSSKGYLDLVLLSQCKHQISGQGSLGCYAFLFNNNTKKRLIYPETYSIDWKSVFCNYNIEKIAVDESLCDI